MKAAIEERWQYLLDAADCDVVASEYAEFHKKEIRHAANMMRGALERYQRALVAAPERAITQERIAAAKVRLAELETRLPPAAGRKQ